MDSFVIFMCVDGEVDITAGSKTETIKMGETVLIPAQAEAVMFNSKHAKLLEVTVNGSHASSFQKAS